MIFSTEVWTSVQLNPRLMFTKARRHVTQGVEQRLSSRVVPLCLFCHNVARTAYLAFVGYAKNQLNNITLKSNDYLSMTKSAHPNQPEPAKDQTSM